MTTAVLPIPSTPQPDTLLRCLVLALLVHVCLVVWIGNVPGGSAAPGQGLWGRVDAIELRLGTPGGSDSTAPSTAAPQPLPDRGPAGGAALPRMGGAVREETPATPPPAAEPGAAQLGDWSPLTRPPAAERDLLPTATAPMPAAVSAPLSLPELGKVAAPPPAERALAGDAAPRAPAAVAAPALERSTPLAAPTLRPPGPLPELAPPPLPALAPLPSAPAAPAAVQPLPAAPAAAAAQPLQLPNVPVPVAVPVPIQVPVPAPAAAPIPVPTPVPVPVPVPVPAPAVPPAAVTAAPAPSPAAPPALSAPAGAPAITAPVQAGAGRGAADAGPRVGPDAATAPSAAASASAPLNLALPRNRGGPLSGGATPGVLSLLPRPPEKNKLGDAVEKSAKGDCRNAYSGLGPLAVVPLAVDAARKDGGCKW